MRAFIESASNGKTFTMRLVRQGDRYGRAHCLTHDNARPLVEFYDSAYAFERDESGEVLGQFVSRYYADTLTRDTDFAYGKRGLCLDGGNAAVWSIDAHGMKAAIETLNDWLAR